MAGDLGLRHGETHVGKEPPLPALANVPLGLGVRLGRGGTENVDTELLGEPVKLSGSHTSKCAWA